MLKADITLWIGGVGVHSKDFEVSSLSVVYPKASFGKE